MEDVGRPTSSEVANLSVLTWNIWNDPADAQLRMDLFVEQVRKLDPDVLLLQEVTEFTQRMWNGPLCEAGPYRSVTAAPRDMPYYTLIASRYPLTRVQRVPFARSTMYRDWLSAYLVLPGDQGTVFVSTSHLESLGSGSLEREKQLDAALRYLFAPEPMLCLLRIFGGDMNLKMQSDGDPMIPPSHYTDVWLATHKCDKEPPCPCGATRVSQRIDRLFAACGANVVSAQVIGQKKNTVGNREICASDHLGVMAVFSLLTSAKGGRGGGGGRGELESPDPPRVVFSRPANWMKYI